MRILCPTLARQFRLLVPEPVIFCSISPFSVDPEGIMYRRDPQANPKEVAARIHNFFIEETEALEAAEVRFCNQLGLKGSVMALGQLVTAHLHELDV